MKVENYPIRIIEGNAFTLSVELQQIAFGHGTGTLSEFVPLESDRIRVWLVSKCDRIEAFNVAISANELLFSFDRGIKLGLYDIEIFVYRANNTQLHCRLEKRIYIVPTTDNMGIEAETIKLTGAVMLVIDGVSLQWDDTPTIGSGAVVTSNGIAEAFNNFIGNDREYDSDENTKGYVILRNDKTLAEQLTQANTIYEVRYNFDLDGDTLTIPEGCVLKFNGGKISNGTIRGAKTSIESSLYQIFDNVTISGSWLNYEMYIEWFGAKSGDTTFDNSGIISTVAHTFSRFSAGRGTYYCSSVIDLSDTTITHVNVIGTLQYTTTETANTFIKIKTNGGDVYINRILGPNSNITSETEKSIGIEFVNCNNSKFQLNRVQGFYNNILITGDNAGNAYNYYNIQLSQMSKILVHIRCVGTGWVNSNQYSFQRLTNYTSSYTYADCAIKFSNCGSANDNIVTECNIENMNKNENCLAPIQANALAGYEFENIRNEDNGTYFLYITNYINDCSFEFAYGFNRKIRTTNTLTHINGVTFSYNNEIKTKRLIKRYQATNYIKGSSGVYAPPFLTINGSDMLGTNAFYGPKSNTTGFCFIFFNASDVTAKVLTIHTGWKNFNIVIAYYDENKTRLNTGNYMILPCGRNSYTATSTYYYSNGSTAESENILLPELSSEIRYVSIGISHDPNNLNMNIKMPYIEIDAQCSGDFHNAYTELEDTINIKTTANRIKDTEHLNVGSTCFDSTLKKQLTVVSIADDVIEDVASKTGFASSKWIYINNPFNDFDLLDYEVTEKSNSYYTQIGFCNIQADSSIVRVVNANTSKIDTVQAYSNTEYRYLAYRNTGADELVSLIIRKRILGIRWIESDGARAGVRRSGLTTQRPSASDIYIGYMYFDASLEKPIYAKSVDIENDVVIWVDATGTIV